MIKLTDEERAELERMDAAATEFPTFLNFGDLQYVAKILLRLDAAGGASDEKPETVENKPKGRKPRQAKPKPTEDAGGLSALDT